MRQSPEAGLRAAAGLAVVLAAEAGEAVVAATVERLPGAVLTGLAGRPSLELVAAVVALAAVPPVLAVVVADAVAAAVAVAAVAVVAVAAVRLGLWLAALVAWLMRDGDEVLEPGFAALLVEAVSRVALPEAAELEVLLLDAALRLVVPALLGVPVAVAVVVAVLAVVAAGRGVVTAVVAGAAAAVAAEDAAGALALAVAGAAVGRGEAVAALVAAGWVGFGAAAAAGAGAGAVVVGAAGRRACCGAGGVPRSFRRVPTRRRSGSSSWFRATRRSTLVP